MIMNTNSPTLSSSSVSSILESRSKRTRLPLRCTGAAGSEWTESRGLKGANGTITEPFGGRLSVPVSGQDDRRCWNPPTSADRIVWRAYGWLHLDALCNVEVEVISEALIHAKVETQVCVANLR